MQRENRRSHNDRRQKMSTVSFPLRCSNNSVIFNDRRIKCERRVESIEVSESKISEEEFMSMLKYSNTNTSFNSTPSQNNEDDEIFDNCIIND